MRVCPVATVPEATWEQISFASTLHLGPILSVLLRRIPVRHRHDLHLGLQEALVNAVKHGNCSDPSKLITVRYARSGAHHWWVITDQGCGFGDCPPLSDRHTCQLPDSSWESGRGLYILRQVFDQVIWNETGNQLSLCRYLPHPLLAWQPKPEQVLLRWAIS